MKAPPLLVSYSTLNEYIDALEPGLRQLHEEGIRRLVDQGLPPVVSSRCLAVLFGYSTKFINAMSKQNWKYYRTFVIRQGRKRRIIQAPKVALKSIQKWFGTHLSGAIEVDECVYGFVSGKSAPAAASQHVNARWVYSVDIADYFSTTPKANVESALVEIGYPDRVAPLLAGLMCYKGYLAQGSPASPVLSNLILRNIDQELRMISDEYRVRFTRYADDIVFSGLEQFPEDLGGRVRELFDATPWSLSAEKEYYSQIPKRLKVHGLLVHGERPRLTKGYRNRIRAYKHLLSAEKIDENDIRRIKGHIKYADSIDELEI